MTAIKLCVAMKKPYILRKFVYADSPHAALKAARRIPYDEIYIDGKWLENQFNESQPVQGFVMEANQESELTSKWRKQRSKR